MDLRIQSFDSRLASALDDVPVPEGLAGRLLARLGEPAEPPAAEAVVIASTTANLPVLESTATPDVVAAEAAVLPMRRGSRRRWLVVTGSLAASVLVALGCWEFFGPRDDSNADLGQLAAGWYPQLASHWETVAKLPAGYAVPRAVAATARGWQWVSRVAGHKGVAFDLSRPGEGRAVLFVVRMGSRDLPAAPPATPQSATGGLTVAAWQSGGLAYVLVVEGDDRFYRRLIQTPAVRFA